MEVWRGDISIHTEDSTSKLHEVHLWDTQSPPNGQSIIRQNATLTYLAFANPAAVPLQCLICPAFEVYTNNGATKAWFDDTLLASLPRLDDEDEYVDSPWWTSRKGQSEVGILLKVEGNNEESRSGPKVSELLLYAATSSYVELRTIGILTPPRSSSPNPEDDTLSRSMDDNVRTVKVYALPLLSESYARSTALDLQLPSPQSPRDENKGVFLPPFLSNELQPKKRRLDTLFDDAAKKSKRSRKRGGESIAEAMASLDHTRLSKQDLRRSESAGPRPSTATDPTIKVKSIRTSTLSRAHSVGSLRDLDPPRPPSRAGNTTRRPRSSLHRVASIATLTRSASPVPDRHSSLTPNPLVHDPTPTFPGLQSSPRDFATQNRTSLSRILLAGLRMHGYSQRRTKPPPPPTVSAAGFEVPAPSQQPTDAPTSAEEAEFKALYHQTFKAATFAWRRSWEGTVVSTEGLRETVDRVLEIFCEDPLSGVGDVGSGAKSTFGTSR